MPSRFVRIPRRLAVEPLEVMINHKLGRIIVTPRDCRSWEARKEELEPEVLAGSWCHYDLGEITSFDLSLEDIVEVDLDEHLDRYILGHAAERQGLPDLASALLAGDIDHAEDLLRALENA